MHWRDIEGGCGGARLAVLGDPVEHSLSPKMQTSAMRALGIDAEYAAIRCTADEFAECIVHLARSGFFGANVTVPHKASAYKLATAMDEESRILAAANTLRFTKDGILAKNTDVAGFYKPIAAIAPGNALLLGAGGAARGAAYALLKNGWNLRLWNRTRPRAQTLANDLRQYGNAEIFEQPSPKECKLIVNATAVGLNAEGLPPLLWDELDAEAVVYDLVYGDSPTSFLRKAKESGSSIIDGREMLVEQGALSFEWWFDKVAPKEIMRRAVGL